MSSPSCPLSPLWHSFCHSAQNYFSIIGCPYCSFSNNKSNLTTNFKMELEPLFPIHTGLKQHEGEWVSDDRIFMFHYPFNNTHVFPPEGFSGRCNFEFDLCSWRQSQDDDFDWLIKPGNMHTHGTGPSTDHTLRNPLGHYLYLDGSFPQTTGHTAQIVGPLFRYCSRVCKVSSHWHFMCLIHWSPRWVCTCIIFSTIQWKQLTKGKKT